LLVDNLNVLSHFVDTLAEFALSLISSMGYGGIFLVSFLENVFTPIPSEAVFPFAGILVTRGEFELFPVVAMATLGSVAGAYVFYALGYIMGSERFRALIIKFGHYFFVSEKDVNRAEKWFEKYEDLAVLICRVVPLVRSFISIPAGYVKMPILKFTILTAIGTFVWSLFLVYLGVWFGDSYKDLLSLLDQFQTIVIIAILAGIVWFYAAKLKRKKQIADPSS